MSQEQSVYIVEWRNKTPGSRWQRMQTDNERANATVLAYTSKECADAFADLGNSCGLCDYRVVPFNRTEA